MITQCVCLGCLARVYQSEGFDSVEEEPTTPGRARPAAITAEIKPPA